MGRLIRHATDALVYAALFSIAYGIVIAVSGELHFPTLVGATVACMVASGYEQRRRQKVCDACGDLDDVAFCEACLRADAVTK